MRAESGIIWDAWNRGGPFIGEVRPIGRVTVQVTADTLFAAWPAGLINASKLPVRWFLDAAASLPVVEVPNIRTIDIDRSLDADAGTCDIVLSNQWMNQNSGAISAPAEGVLAEPDERNPRVLGEPGFFSWNHGATAEARARWKQTETSWANLLVPNALLRTYQGYGGAYPMTLAEAVGAGYLHPTGLWLVDDVQIGTEGEVNLKCRDMGKLLIEQQLYPPLVPASMYPLRYCRWIDKVENRQRVVESQTAVAGERTLAFDTSANYAWYSGGGVHGHHPRDAFDGNMDSFYLSVGNSGPEEPYAVEWVQANCGEVIDTVWVRPWAGNYTCYVSVMVDGAWVDGGGGNIPYNEAGVGRYNGAYEARIPYVTKVGIPWEAPISIPLGRSLRAQKVRFTFTNLAHSPWGPYPYRAGIRELRASQQTNETQRTVENYTEMVRYDGNYKDFADIIRDLLLWAGFWLASPGPYSGTADVLGNIESTGTFAESCFPDSAFDRKPVIDAITTIKELVGYIFWVDEDGGARFESPNWWQSGNFLTSGVHTDTIPEIDERIQLTAYKASFSDKAARSEIIIANYEPTAGIAGTVVTRLTPATKATLKGIVKPVMWGNMVMVSAKEQQTMAELIAMHLYFRQRLGTVTAWANPLIQINDQVRIFERMTGDTFVHYVRGMQTHYDAESGEYTMTLTTHWLGDGQKWAVS